MPVIDAAHPQQLLLRVVNPVLRTALRIPGLGAALKDFMVVEFAGRKSGRRFSVPVSAHHLDGDLYVILEAGWKHNFADGAPADVWLGGKKTSMQGQVIKDPATVADVAHRVATAYEAKKAQRSMGLTFSTDAVPSLEEFTQAAEWLRLAAVKLTPRS